MPYRAGQVIKRRTAGLGEDCGKLKRALTSVKQLQLLHCSQSAGPTLADFLGFLEARTLIFLCEIS